MAVAISGCVITKQDTRMMTYVKKCESCGYVLPGQTTTALVRKNVKRASSYLCPKCKKTQKIVIQGV